jgi:glycosyltransferase involved in cell wall biosynthesis
MSPRLPDHFDKKMADTQQRRVDLSFVIPAFNEAHMIGRTLAAIGEFVPTHLTYEVIVVDHGSEDGTAPIARDNGATVIEQRAGFIGALRNAGARAAVGDTLVFLDADVLLTPRWAEAIPGTLHRLEQAPRTLTGSNCDVPPGGSWIETSWFGPQVRNITSHIGSGHLVVRREYLLEVGGFDPSLETGEDYDLCQRVVRGGGVVRIDPALETIHLGFPATVSGFFRRELWHGRGDFRDVRSLLHSRVAVAAVAFGMSHATAVGAVLAGHSTLATWSAGAILTLCLGAAGTRFRGEPVRVIAANCGLYYLYFWARLAAAVHVLTRGRQERRRRPHVSPLPPAPG